MNEVNIADIFKEKENIAVVAHVMPDGDSIGSMLALYNLLKRMGKNIDVYSSDVVPDVYSFLPGISAVKRQFEDKGKRYEAVAVLDCGSMDRTGNFSNLQDMTEIIVNIDHHATNSAFGHINLIDTSASSTGELIFRIIKQMGVEILKDEACCLYTAILTDTGCFRYANTSQNTHNIAGELVSAGIDFGFIHSQIYNNYKYQDIKTLGKAVSSIELYCGGKIAFMHLLQADLEGFSLDEINTNDFINYARDINGVEAAAFAKEIREDEYKVSFRSKNIIDVRIVCEKYGGGGHIRAAGCTIKGNINEVKDTVINELENALKGENIWMEY
jgi:phosphoesterase RecJ-like protein